MLPCNTVKIFLVTISIKVIAGYNYSQWLKWLSKHLFGKIKIIDCSFIWIICLVSKYIYLYPCKICSNVCYYLLHGKHFHFIIAWYFHSLFLLVTLWNDMNNRFGKNLFLLHTKLGYTRVGNFLGLLSEPWRMTWHAKRQLVTWWVGGPEREEMAS
jgi:hypothetical protein